METPDVIRVADRAEFRDDKMGKTTLFSSDRVLVGINAFEPGQRHDLHAHAGMDKVYHVVSGQGRFLLDGEDRPMSTGDLLVAPADVPHGIHNDSDQRLVVLAVLAPSP